MINVDSKLIVVHNFIVDTMIIVFYLIELFMTGVAIGMMSGENTLYHGVNKEPIYT